MTRGPCRTTTTPQAGASAARGRNPSACTPPLRAQMLSASSASEPWALAFAAWLNLVVAPSLLSADELSGPRVLDLVAAWPQRGRGAHEEAESLAAIAGEAGRRPLQGAQRRIRKVTVKRHGRR
eukprot:CAMPEP_0176080600 /NCGR_PEP_ID=MMETSP0120_2-20121206/40316_1 /TAXON_ID=160619 /ORGANISM="Kryptoperidinium foliaceum, Strain CCMP 1326" /LENGTH=123 /DNA_ID=CAMNT_0017414365 /DNA_START=269 /DNA_END=638 /DNA_ORIENTATION=-